MSLVWELSNLFKRAWSIEKYSINDKSLTKTIKNLVRDKSIKNKKEINQNKDKSIIIKTKLTMNKINSTINDRNILSVGHTW